MNILKTSLLAALSGLLLAGCASDNEPIYFASEAKPPVPPPDSLTRMKSLSKADESQIQMLVYDDLLGLHFWDGGDYTAVFVQADEDLVDAIIKKYPGHIPPIKQSWHIDLRSKATPRDKDTGQPVIILGADVGDPNPDGSVDVVGRWYGGAAVQGLHTYVLKRGEAGWAITSVK